MWYQQDEFHQCSALDSQLGCLSIGRLSDVDLVEDSSGIEKSLPNVVNIALPLVKVTPKVQLMCGGVHNGMEYRVVKEEALEKNYLF